MVDPRQPLVDQGKENMSINKNDSTKINYKGTSEHSTERKYRVEEPKRIGDREYLPDERRTDAFGLRGKFKDLKKKAQKLDTVIDELSLPLSIPIDTEKQPRVAFAVNQLDPSSGGEFLSYSLYRDIINQQDAGQRNIDMEWLSENETYDIFANSDLMFDRYIEGAKTYTQLPTIDSSDGGPDMTSVYANTMLNNITNWNEHEFYTRQVVNWAQGWLSETPDPAYIPWTFKEDMKKKIMEYDSLDQVLSTYTDLGNGLKGGVFESLKEPLSLPMDLWDSLNGKSENDNNFFNKINEIFSMNYGADLICCLAAWIGGLDLRTLYALRLMLQLAANGIKIEFSSLKNALISVVNGFVRNIISGQLIAILDLIIQTVTDPINKWLNSNDPMWQKLFLCTPINEAINIYVLGGIDKVHELLEEKILEFMKKVEIDEDYEEKKTKKTKKNKQLQDIIGILDTIIAAAGKSTLCGYEMANIAAAENPVIKKFTDSYKAGPAWSYSYPEEENPNEYNSFIMEETIAREEQVFIEGTSEPTGETKIVEETVYREYYGTAGFDYEAEKANIDQCLKRVTPDEVFSVPEWMEDIRAKATEEFNV